MNKIISKNHVGIVLFLSIFLLNFSPLKPLSYPLTMAPFAILYLLYYFVDIKKIKRKIPSVIILLPFFVILKSTPSLLNGDVVLINFLKTFSLWFFYTTCIILFLFSKIKPDLEGVDVKIKKTISWLLLFILSFVSLQVIYYKISGDVSVFSFWGDFSYASQDYLLSSIEFGASKANGPFLEPAMLGLVTFTLFVMLLILNQNVIHWIATITLSLLSGSASILGGIIFLLGILTLKKQRDSSKRELIFRASVLIFGSVFLVIVSPYLIVRVNDVFIEGTSTYYRFVAPLKVLSDVLLYNPFGITFGMMEDTLLQYGMLNGETEGKSLDNGWYLLVFYFGWPGLALLISALVGGLSAILKGSRNTGIMVVFFILSPLFTGAVFSPEFLLLQMLVLLSYRLKCQYEH
jgi:putative colanic acid polymerase